MANVERGAAITEEIRNTLSNRKHAATAGSACMHAWAQDKVRGRYLPLTLNLPLTL